MRVLRVQAIVTAVVLSVSLVGAQTKITPPKNKYSPQDDVKLGREAAAQVEQQLPLLSDDNVTSYVSDIGQRLVAAIPAELRHPEFRYTFKVVNVKEINAFALPGGPMFVNRGMLEAAKTKGKWRASMAHELSHVALRHGTAQATKATQYEVGTVAGAILGAIVGGNRGQRDRAGHAVRPRHGVPAVQPRVRETGGHRRRRRSWRAPDTTRATWRTCSRRSRSRAGGGGPQWLSDHPNPGNRYNYINKEAQSLHVANAAPRYAVRSRVCRRGCDDVAGADDRGGDAGTPATAAAPGMARRPAQGASAPTSSRRRRATRLTTKGTVSASACRRTGASCRATTP